MADVLTSEQRRRNMSAIRSRDTKPEIAVRKLVFRMGYRFRLHCRDLPGRPDLVFAGRRKIIEVRGCFWHNHTCKDGTRSPETNSEYWKAKIARNVTRDRQNARQLRALGWHILEIWECESKELSTLEVLIRTFLDEDFTLKSKRLNG
jgi:DNA mismatch endonuclease, patch repair protein